MVSFCSNTALKNRQRTTWQCGFEFSLSQLVQKICTRLHTCRTPTLQVYHYQGHSALTADSEKVTAVWCHQWHHLMRFFFLFSIDISSICYSQLYGSSLLCEVKNLIFLWFSAKFWRFLSRSHLHSAKSSFLCLRWWWWLPLVDHNF